jgi:hypothetical protein
MKAPKPSKSKTLSFREKAAFVCLVLAPAVVSTASPSAYAQPERKPAQAAQLLPPRTPIPIRRPKLATGPHPSESHAKQKPVQK